MILFIDIRKEMSTIGMISAQRTEWITSKTRGGIFDLLQRADKKHHIFNRKPSTVVVATGERDGDVSWSAVRTAVATGNTLAFAWDVPVVGLDLPAKASKDDMTTAIRAMAGKAKPAQWLKAAYGGEPNITKAKAIF